MLAGLDTNARVHERQFQEFQRQFRDALTMLQSISALWNRQDPCIISGFDMDRSKATAALANQPLGTFICRFSMNRSGCLVLSCKVQTSPGIVCSEVLQHLSLAADRYVKAQKDTMVSAVERVQDALVLSWECLLWAPGCCVQARCIAWWL